MWGMSCCPLQSTRVQPRYLVGFVLLDLVCVVFSFFVLLHLAIMLCHSSSVYPFGIFKLFVSRSEYINVHLVSGITDQAKYRNVHLVTKTHEQVEYRNVHLVSGTPEEVQYINVYLVFRTPE